MLDWDLDKKVPISGEEFSQVVAYVMNSEPFVSMVQAMPVMEDVFARFGASVGSILFYERTRVEK